MAVKDSKVVAGRILSALVLLLLVSPMIKGERLPIKTYTTADGLAHNVVNRVVRDSRGFLWFCTREGLSRFDGYSFTNYGIEQGLPSAIVNDLLESREGVYWVATADGLCRFNPLGKPQTVNNGSETDAAAMFTVYFPAEDGRSKYVLSLLQDRAGGIWCGTRNGLYRVETAEKVKHTTVDLGIPDYLQSRSIECLLEDRLGALWVGAASGLYRRWPDGRVEAYTVVMDCRITESVHCLRITRGVYGSAQWLEGCVGLCLIRLLAGVLWPVSTRIEMVCQPLGSTTCFKLPTECCGPGVTGG